MVDGIDRPLAVVGTTGDIRPEGFNLRLDGIDVDVTHYDNRLVVRSVPFMVVVTEGLVCEIIDDRGVADDVTFGVLGTRVHLRVHLFPYTPACRATRTPFLEDDAALRIDLFVQKEQTAAPVVHDKERRVHDSCAVRRYIRETIDGLVDRGIGIDVSAEIHTHGLEIIDDAFAREVLGAVEGHMLQKMRQTVLVILFEDSTHSLCDMELCALFGLFVMTDIIGQSVV